MFWKTSGRWDRWVPGLVTLLIALLSLHPRPVVLAVAIVVNSPADTVADDGQCTLREAIVAANADTASGSLAGECVAGAGDDTIDLTALNGSIVLVGALPQLESNMVLNGPGAAGLAIRRGSSGGDYRILAIGSDAIVTLSGLTIGNGRVVDGGGGGILNLGTLTVEACVVRDNSAYDGGGIYNEGTLTLDSSTIRGNEAIRGDVFAAEGGGIYNLSVLELTHSTVYDNRARDLGGGIYSGDQVGAGSTVTVSLTNSSVISNSAMHGGGILIDGGMIESVHSTIAGNSAVKVGEFGGVGGGFRYMQGAVRFKSSLIADNTAATAGADCYSASAPDSLDYNLLGDGNGCNWTPQAHDLVNVAPRLGPLQDNGGLTETRALLVGSPAFDAIPVGSCTDLSAAPVRLDQRGVLRPQGAGCDIGSVEAQTAELRLDKMASSAELSEGESVAFVIQVDNDGPLEATGLVISDVLPIGLTFVTSSASQGTYASGSGQWTVGGLQAGLGASLSLTATLETGTAGKTITNVAAIVAVGQFDSDPTDNMDAATLTIPVRRFAYLPGVLNGYTLPATFPVRVGQAIAQRPVKYRGEMFYTASVDMPAVLPSGGSFHLSARPYTVTEVMVDDKVLFLLDGRELFSFDFSTSGRPRPALVEVPRATVAQMAGQALVVEYRDVYGSVVEASELWLIWVP